MATTQIPTLAVAALAAATLAPTRAECGPEPPTRHFGPFGVARGQVARLNLANGGIILPCVAELSFVDAAGHLIVRALHTLAAGEAAFLDVDLTPPPEPDAEATPPRWSRKTLRGLVKLSPPPEPEGPAPTCVTTLEVFDGTSGRTQLLLGGPDTIPAEMER